MMLIKTIILSGWFASVSCYEFKNFKLPSTNPPITDTDMAQLFELCFANTTNPIVITENLVETFHKNLPITIRAPVIIINENFIAKDIQLYNPTYPMYILSVSSAKEMFKLLVKLHHSPLWSRKSKVFVIFETDKPCVNSWEILKRLWRFQVLSSIIACSGTSNETTLFTYNPFTKRAPDPWVDNNMYYFDFYNRPVFLFNQSFSNDHKICETLFFDKTEFLDGYPVNIAATYSTTDLLLRVVFNSLNMTPQVTYFGNNIHKLFWSIVTEKNDICTSYKYDMDPRSVDTVPLKREIYFIIVTQKANFLSASDEIANVIDINGAIAIIFLLLLITLLIVLHNEYQIGLAVLDVLKLLMSMGIDAPLDRLAMKITFFTGFFFVFLFSPLLEGQLFAVLTRPPTYNIESLKDLYDHKYHVYCPTIVEDHIMEEQLWNTVEARKYLHSEDSFDFFGDCLTRVSTNNTVACILPDEVLINYALKKNLHISERFMLKVSGFYQTTHDWVLADRFYHKGLNFQESGIFDRLSSISLKNPLKKIKAKERLKKIVDYQTIDAVDLTYLYVFMAFFQCLAIIVFGIEYIIGRYRRPRQ
ncbi:uncharacterized protein LOC130663576 [Microplitis mediator]|uniref:uncharacterized protein LOC130663576 n=1 Tax=Microplitis mediator TaxID=375433 RepID=UPI002557974A|nr:uncharacterized protein LOC130663576 [Microplitis mediator]